MERLKKQSVWGRIYNQKKKEKSGHDGNFKA